jgi:hypothetical protein
VLVGVPKEIKADEYRVYRAVVGALQLPYTSAEEQLGFALKR